MASDISVQTPNPPTSQNAFPSHRLTLRQRYPKKQPLCLVACGSFSPITYLHLRMFEMASDYVCTLYPLPLPVWSHAIVVYFPNSIYTFCQNNNADITFCYRPDSTPISKSWVVCDIVFCSRNFPKEVD
jgi:hypothetical protein